MLLKCMHVQAGSLSRHLVPAASKIATRAGRMFMHPECWAGAKAGAAAAVAGGWHLLGSFLYCCALNHKQMAMYYAPAFFAHLLGTCLQRPGIPGKVQAACACCDPAVATTIACFLFIILSWNLRTALVLVSAAEFLRQALGPKCS